MPARITAMGAVGKNDKALGFSLVNPQARGLLGELAAMFHLVFGRFVELAAGASGAGGLEQQSR